MSRIPPEWADPIAYGATAAIVVAILGPIWLTRLINERVKTHHRPYWDVATRGLREIGAHSRTVTIGGDLRGLGDPVLDLLCWARRGFYVFALMVALATVGLVILP